MDHQAGKLDRKRSFGTVYNDPNIGFAQDGKHFRHDGTLYVPPDAKPSQPTVAPADSPPPQPGPLVFQHDLTKSEPEPTLTHSEKMKQVWAARRAAEADADAQR